MASSSTAKKVARIAARSGSGSGASAGKAAKQRNWLFGLAIVAIVALGVGAVAFARHQNDGLGDNTTKPRARIGDSQAFDHWHASFAVDICGKEQPALQDAAADVQGIHTHGEGLIHIHPFTTRAAGKKATLSRFFKQTGVTVSNEGIKLADGKVYKPGTTECGGKATELVLAHWKDAATAVAGKPDKVFTEDFGDVRLTEDLGAYTLALVAKGDRNIAPPSASANIADLGAKDGGATPADSTATTTVPATEPETATTTAPADTATTTAPADSTTTTEAAG